jgi:hypothetical protein
MANTDTPDWRPDYWRNYLSPLWKRLGDVFHGLHTEELKRRYLRQQLGEHDKVYEARVDSVAFANKLSPAVKAHAGLLSEFTLDDDAPQSARDAADDFDGQGNSLESVLLDWDIEALQYNAVLALVDTPPAETGDAQRQARRPRFVSINLRDVHAPQVIMIDGHLEISLISIRRSVAVPDGRFGYTMRDRYWVFSLEELETPLPVPGGTIQRYQCIYEEWEEVESSKDTGLELVQTKPPAVITNAAGRPLARIPIVWYSPYGDPLLFFGVDNDIDRGGTPEYMPLVDFNLEFFNKHSSLNTAEDRCNYAMLVKSYPGSPPENEPDIAASGRVITLSGGASLNLLEPEGTAIASTREGQRDRVEAMEQMAQAFLSGGQPGRTATEAMIESTQARLGLRNIARRKESAVQSVFTLWEQFSNPEWTPETPVGGITVSESVLSVPPTAQELQFWQSEFLAGALTKAEYDVKRRELGVYTEEMEAAAAGQPAPLVGNALGLAAEPREVA